MRRGGYNERTEFLLYSRSVTVSDIAEMLNIDLKNVEKNVRVLLHHRATERLKCLLVFVIIIL